MSHTTALQRLRDAGLRAFLAGDLAGGLVRMLTRPRNQRQDQPRGHADTALVNALAEEGCPVCRTNSEHDDRYFFSCTKTMGRSKSSRSWSNLWGSALPMARRCSPVWTRLRPSWRSFTRRLHVISFC